MSQNFPQDLYKPEKLNLWDRLFNRYKYLPVNKGSEEWSKRFINRYYGYVGEKTIYYRDFVEYHKIDRLTGSYTIEKEYLN